MQYVLPNTMLKKCPSKHNAMCPSENEAGIKLELKENCSFHRKGPLLQLDSSGTYPYPKGEHNINGAVGPKYASLKKVK